MFLTPSCLFFFATSTRTAKAKAAVSFLPETTREHLSKRRYTEKSLHNSIATFFFLKISSNWLRASSGVQRRYPLASWQRTVKGRKILLEDFFRREEGFDALYKRAHSSSSFFRIEGDGDLVVFCLFAGLSSHKSKATARKSSSSKKSSLNASVSSSTSPHTCGGKRLVGIQGLSFLLPRKQCLSEVAGVVY